MQRRRIAACVGAAIVLAAVSALGAVVSYEIPSSSVSTVAGTNDGVLRVAVPLSLEPGALIDWAYLHLDIHAERTEDAEDRDEMLCLAIGPASVPEGGSSATFGDYSVLPGMDRTLIFDVTALARAWLADPGATQEIVLKGCDAVSDVCVLRAVSHGSVSGKLVIGYGRR